jgi:hypothetical protein
MGTELRLEGEAMSGAILGCCRGTVAFVDADAEAAELRVAKPDGLTVRSLLLLYVLVVPCAAGGGAQYGGCIGCLAWTASSSGYRCGDLYCVVGGESVC